MDFLSLDANYNCKINNQFSVGFFSSRTFYNKSNSTLNSNIKGNFGINADYCFGFLEFYVESNLLFSEKKDVNLELNLSHEFSFGKNNGFTITPIFDVKFSTLNYYEAFLNKKIGKKTGNNHPNIVSITSLTTVDNNHFTLMDYEISLPTNYTRKKITYFVIPTLALPVNTVYTKTKTTTTLIGGTESIIVKNATTPSELNLKNTFFVEFGMYYTLDF